MTLPLCRSCSRSASTPPRCASGLLVSCRCERYAAMLAHAEVYPPYLVDLKHVPRLCFGCVDVVQRFSDEHQRARRHRTQQESGRMRARKLWRSDIHEGLMHFFECNTLAPFSQ
jgi:hypothetical protein